MNAQKQGVQTTLRNYFGELIPQNPCQQKPCLNGGECIFQDNRQDYRCNCTGYTGEHCDAGTL